MKNDAPLEAAAQAGCAVGAARSQLSTPESQPPPPIPDHELLRCIGQGSYGEVWLARNVMGEYRAVKIVYRRTFGENRPFEREFEGIRKFEPISRSHESQVHILHVGLNAAAGCFYYVMELADQAEPGPKAGGPASPPAADSERQASSAASPSQTHRLDAATYAPRTLRFEVERHGRLPLAQCIEIGLALTTALGHLHRHGLVHRDIKPSNIIFVNGRPKLADIGLVTDAGDARSIVGTEGYLAPEGPGTPQADLYSLGKVLYEMSTGRDRRHFPDLPLDLRDWPDCNGLLELNEILLKACARDPSRRYQSAGEMHAELALLERGQSVKRKRAVERRWAVARKSSFAAALVAMLVGMLFYFRVEVLRRDTVPPAQSTSIAILPFALEGQNQADEYLSEALPEQLIHTLTTIHGLKVASPNSSLAFKDRKEDPRRIGDQLKVRTFLQGTIRKSDNRLNIVATLINVSNGARLWAQAYDCEMKDLPATESDIAQNVATALKGPLSQELRQRLAEPLTTNREAYQLYLEGSYFLHRWSEASIDPAIERLEKATALDPKFAAAQAELAQAYVQKAFTFDPQQRWQAKASAAIGTALLLNPNCAEAFLARSKFLWSSWSRFQHDLAVKDLRRALALDVNLAEAYQHLAMVYVHVGLFDKAREASSQALQLDPLNPGALYREGVANLYDGRYQEALAVFKRVPHSYQTELVTMQTATTLFYLGRTNNAKSQLDELLIEKPNDALLRSTLALLFAASGRTEKAEEEILVAAAKEKDYFGHYHHVSYNIASAYALMKDRTNALDWLGKAAVDGYPCYPRFEKDPNLDNLRGDPQFKTFMEGLKKQFEQNQKTL